MHCDDLQQIRAAYAAQLKTMSTEALVSYTLNRDHCDVLEKELAERLQEIVRFKNEQS